jgi:dipeptidyl aminopeptidase/acylaminoacyl peptidase
MSPALTPEMLVYGFTPASDPRVSPDGSRILYIVTTTNRQSNKVASHLWLCDIDGGDRRQLTHGDMRNGSGRWSPDGRTVSFVSDRVKKSGLFVLPVAEGGEAREITRHGQAIGNPAWSPDGRQIAYTTQVDPENPDETDLPEGAASRVRVTRRLDYKQDGRGYLNDTRVQVFVVGVEDGARRQVTTVPADHDGPCWSPDGRWLAARRASHNGMCSQLALVAVETGETRLMGEAMGDIDLWAWSPSGDRVLFAGDTAKTWRTDWFLYDLATDTTRRLTEDLACLPASGYPGPLPSPPVWLDDRHVLFHALRAGNSGLYTLDCASGQVEPVQDWPARHVGLSVDTAQRVVVQGHASPSATGEIAVFDRQAGTMRVVSDFSAAVLREAPPARVERLAVPRGRFTIDAWLLTPPDFDPARRYPLVLDIHGGPHNLYGDHFSPMQQCLATHGFLVAYANPRGSGSYGPEFTRQVVGDWGGEDYLDLLAVVDAVLARPYADAARTGIHGYSYGGYMTAWMIGQTDRFKAAVSGAPVFDLESFYGTSDIGHIFGELEFGSGPHAGQAWYAAHSPSTFAHRARTPTLIVHGEADERCPIGQGEQLFVALAKAGCEVEFVRYPGGAHGFSGGGPPEHRLDLLTRTLAWFKHHLGEPI